MNIQELEVCRRSVSQLLQLAAETQVLILRTRESVTCSGSQHSEDKILEELLAPYDTATYVDVGANRPEECSNTWKFYQKGWHGLLIEPLYTCWPLILKKRKRDTLWPDAAADYTGAARLRVCDSVSSMRPDWNIAAQGDVLVEVDTLKNILAEFPEIRDQCKLCSIDVEGLETAVLKGIDWETFKPDVFIIEYREFQPAALGKDLSGEWLHILTAHGYREVWRSNLNIIFLCDGRKAPWEKVDENTPDP